MDLDIEGNAALVTASSSGLGKAAATALAREGVDVAINGRDPERLAAAEAEVDAAGPGAVRAVQADLTDPDEVRALVDTATEAFGGLDHLVTSAGGPPSGWFLETDDTDWYEAYDLLVMSVVRLVRAAEPQLRRGDGTIVTITSRTVKEALDSLVLSNSVRMGVIGLEKTLSRELAPEIRANAILPGPHETARIRTLVEQAVDRGEAPSYEAGLADWADNPMDRIGDPMELGDLVAFLSSPRSAFVNGAAIPIDGGASRSNL